MKSFIFHLFPGAVNGFFSTGQNPLFRAVSIRQYKVGCVVGEFTQTFQRGFHGQHTAAAILFSGFGHGTAPGNGQVKKCGLIDPACSAKCRQLTKGVPAGHCRFYTKAFQYTGHGQTDGTNGGLGDIRAS